MSKSDRSVIVEMESPNVSPQLKPAETVVVNIPPDPEESSDEQNTATFSELFLYYIQRFSMHGLGLLVGADNRIVKVIWTVIILAAIFEVSVHIRSLITKYLEYSTRTEITLGFSSLQFPAVTICNANMMKKSKVPGIVSLLTKNLEAPQNLTVTKLAKNNPYKMKRAHKSFLRAFKNNSEFDYTELETKYYVKVDPGSWEAVAKRADSDVFIQLMKNMYSSWNVSEQKRVGHQAEQLIMSCTFAKRECFRNFVQHTNAEYGNCYTIEDKRFLTKQSGPSSGLQVVLDLETDEYISHLTPTKGAQIIIHAPNTVPLPCDEGISVPAGTQTMIGLKEQKIKRLGEPYSPCIKPDEYYKNLYNTSYTRKLCQKICYLKRIAKQCNCLDNQYSHIGEVIKLKMNKSCSFQSKDLECVARIRHTFKAEDAECRCLNPCSEVTFDLQTGYRQGPDKVLLDAMVKEICYRDPEKCQRLKQKSISELRENYVIFNIFYRDLNYEQMSEQKNYEISQLLSDFGGSLGLFIGLSFLSLLELTHMIFGLTRYLICKARRRK